MKLFGSILDSSVWVGTSKETKLVWITMLAMADWDGYVNAAIPGLAQRAGVSLSECEAALSVLEAPDPYSKNPDHEGRRAEKVQGGWLLLNYEEYREIQTRKQMQDAARQRKYRSKKRDGSVTGRNVTPEKRDITPYIDTDKDKEVDTDIKSKHMGSPYDDEFDAWYALYPKRSGSNRKAEALGNYRARRKEGVSRDALLSKVQAYAAYCEATGIVGTENVAQAKSWLGPKYRGWEESWAVPEREKSWDDLIAEEKAKA